MLVLSRDKINVSGLGYFSRVFQISVALKRIYVIQFQLVTTKDCKVALTSKVLSFRTIHSLKLLGVFVLVLHKLLNDLVLLLVECLEGIHLYVVTQLLRREC